MNIEEIRKDIEELKNMEPSEEQLEKIANIKKKLKKREEEIINILKG